MTTGIERTEAADQRDELAAKDRRIRSDPKGAGHTGGGVGNGKQRVSGFDRCDSNLSGGDERMTRDDLFDNVHGTGARWYLRFV